MDFSKGVLGSVIVAVGTITAAVGSTPSNIITGDLRNSLNMWGNILQAGGNALQAEVQGDFLRTTGKEFQSIGNVTVFTGVVFDKNKQTSQKLFITGNWIQALGGFINVGHGLELTPFPGHPENIIGNVLQATGNSLQAMGGVKELNKIENTDKSVKEQTEGNSSYRMEGIYEYGKALDNEIDKNDGEFQLVTGSWIQAIGSVISMIGTIKETRYTNESQ
ncbi:DUF6944 family repetitive protein [Peribacillus simplex]|uniref:DUF6944 family repetitive protein n=1 Tax=Peribacillus simplex TaxID=1478 RepID=UPI00367027EA